MTSRPQGPCGKRCGCRSLRRTVLGLQWGPASGTRVVRKASQRWKAGQRDRTSQQRSVYHTKGRRREGGCREPQNVPGLSFSTLSSNSLKPGPKAEAALLIC